MAKVSTKVNAKTAPVAEVEKTTKLNRAVEIVRAAFAKRAEQIAAKAEEVISARAVAIDGIRKELFPGDNQKAACNTYYALAYNALLNEHTEQAQLALSKGKPVHSVYKTHRAKDRKGQVSQFGLVTSQAAAKQLMTFLGADGYCKGVAVEGKLPNVA